MAQLDMKRKKDFQNIKFLPCDFVNIFVCVCVR